MLLDRSQGWNVVQPRRPSGHHQVNGVGHDWFGLANALTKPQPDLLVVLADRYEIFAAASMALVARIPIAHTHGGELT